MEKTTYNKTQCDPFTAVDRAILHRDIVFAHLFRWSHVLKNHKLGQSVLDVGCGTGNLLQMLYRNMHKCDKYLGLDVRSQTISKAKETWSIVDWAQFDVEDFVNLKTFRGSDWDLITCFEVAEHIGHWNINSFLTNIKKHMNENTLLLLSTPNHDGTCADNHMIMNLSSGIKEVGEFTYDEITLEFEKVGLKVIDARATFASISDYKKSLNEWQIKAFEKAKEYYDSNVLSILMAPLVDPKLGRNIMWKLKI